MVAMRMTAGCRRQITEPSEGRRLVAYRDCVGVWTIGYGHTSRAGVPIVRSGMRITDAQADQILADDLAVFEKGVQACFNKPIPQWHFDAFVDLAFNIGMGAFRSSSVLRFYRAGQTYNAAQGLLAWNKAGGKVMPGLVKRREAERQWFFYGHLNHSTVAPAHLAAIEPEDMPHEVDYADGVMMRGFNRIVGLSTGTAGAVP